MEVHRRIPGGLRGRAGCGISALKALQARPRLQLGAVHGEVLVRQQTRLSCLRGHRIEKRSRHVARQQPVPILRERRGMPHRIVQVQPDEPAKQQWDKPLWLLWFLRGAAACPPAAAAHRTGREVARVGLFEHAPDDGSILTEHNRGAWELARLISMRLGFLPDASAAVTA